MTMATQSVLSFPCRKAKVLSPKIMNSENGADPLAKSIYGRKPDSTIQRSIMTQPKSPRKRFGDLSNSTDTLSQELFDEIFKLSPRSPIRKIENVSSLIKKSSKNSLEKPQITSPTRSILSPVRALSLSSPKKLETENNSKHQKILQLKLQRIGVTDPKSPVKLRPDQTPILDETVTPTTRVKKSISNLLLDSTASDAVVDSPKRLTRSSRKLRNRENITDDTQDDFKENVPPGSCPTPTKKQRPSPKPKNIAATAKSASSKRRAARMLQLNSEAKIVSPKKLEMNDDDVVNSSPEKMLKSPRKLLNLHEVDSLPYLHTKRALHSSLPDELIGRDHEMRIITDFVSSRINCHKSGSLYISGAPGTGKSACATKVLSDEKITQKARVISINCMSSRNANAIYSKIAQEMGALPSNYKTVKSAVRYLEKALTSEGPSVLLLLDEMDQLDSKNHEVLYTIFEWPSLQSSRLVLIGIANALDMTDRILPRLQTRKNCRPSLINFRPYSKDQIVAILEGRVHKKSDDKNRVLDPMAIQFCARKVSAVAGDARKALDICRRAVEVVETNIKSQKVLTPDGPLRKVGLKEIAGVFSEVYESSISHNKNSGEDDSFPLQQKLAICTLMLLARHIKCKEVHLGKLHETYAKICKKRQVTAVGQSEFLSMLHLIETRGIITIKSAKQARMSKVCLALQEKDVEYALCDKALLSAILQEGCPK